MHPESLKSQRKENEDEWSSGVTTQIWVYLYLDLVYLYLDLVALREQPTPHVVAGEKEDAAHNGTYALPDRVDSDRR